MNDHKGWEAGAECGQKTTQKTFGKLYESIHPFSTDFHEARCLKMPNAAI